MDLFVYAVRTTSGNKISKKKKPGADKDDCVCFFFKKKGLYRENEGVHYPHQSLFLQLRAELSTGLIVPEEERRSCTSFKGWLGM